MEENKLTDPRTLRAYAHPLRIRLIGLLRSEGPMTATQAAAALDDNVPNCSFHLRQLAKYGFAERVPGADARERPWRATAATTSWDDDSDDPAMRAAADQLNAVLLGEFTRRAQEYLAVRADEPSEWRAAAGFGDALVYVTATELRELIEQMEALTDRFADRADRPADARPIQLIQLAIPRGPVPGSPAPGGSAPDGPAPGGPAPGGSAPGGSAPGGSAPGGSAPSDPGPRGPAPSDPVPGGPVAGESGERG